MVLLPFLAVHEFISLKRDTVDFKGEPVVELLLAHKAWDFPYHALVEGSFLHFYFECGIFVLDL